MVKTHRKQNINQAKLGININTGLKYFNDSKAFIEYLNDIDNIYKNIEE